MASRRDELNAYTFAKKRLVAQFLQPSPTGTEEGAPRPLRGVLPGLIVGVLILAGFGAWGMFKPKAPEGLGQAGKNVIIGSESTTRYVVLKTDKKAQLHPVLNLASAKLLLDPTRARSPSRSTRSSSTTARSRTAPRSASPTRRTGCPTPRRPGEEALGGLRTARAGAAGQSRRPPSSSPNASRRRSRARTGCAAAT